MVNSNKLKSLMVLKGFSQRKLADETGIGLNPLNAKINNKTVFRCDEVDKICEALGITDVAEKWDIFFA